MMKNKKKIIPFIIAVVVYALVMFLVQSGMLSRQMTSIIIPVCVNVMLSVSLCLIIGFLGELTLGHAGFMSIGAYTGALITINTAGSMPVWLSFTIAIIVGGLVAGVLGLLIGMPVLRLKGDYLAIVTLAFGEIIKSIINSLKITNGAAGLSDIPKYSTYKSFTVVYIIAVLMILLVANFVNSRHGRAICSIRDNYIAAEATGLPVSRFKVLAFVISAVFAGIAGVIYAHNVGILKPATFDYNKSIEILVMVVLGGMGNIKGSIIAAIILTLLPEVLRGVDDYRMLMYSIVLIAMMIINNSAIKQTIISKFRKAAKEDN
ncbi:MAG TPA: branched-chain amino acid ABC transporter permease [Lachnospiraceae bacterium]|nr:branched-chain amino acid ABC transporter permease [Lachnospiraceae bacterium]